MHNNQTQEIMSMVSGLTFTAIGPLLVADLSKKRELFASLPVGKYGMEGVVKDQKTESHVHDFASFYKSEGLNVECEGQEFKLPKKALTLVLPGIAHSWVPQEKKGIVGSVDHRHLKQVVQDLFSIQRAAV